MKTKSTCLSMQKLLFILAILSTYIPYGISQVNVGDSNNPQDFSVLEISTNTIKGGLRLPQLTTDERKNLKIEELTGESKDKAQGLTIFNLSTGCYEYWNGENWVSICNGNAQIKFVDNVGDLTNPTQPIFASAGEERGAFLPSEDSPCTGVNAPYSFTIVSGESFLNIEVIDESTGKFNVSMLPNTTAKQRSAIVRVINNCTGEYRDLLFTQEGDNQSCNASIDKPIVSATNNGELCQGGAVYMTISNPDVNATYIWTLNDIEVSQGTYYTATRVGSYIVYVGAIGCPDNASDKIIVTPKQDNAPAGGIPLYATNNGIICGSTSTTIIAYNVPTTGTLAWYKNGVKDASKSGNQITLQSSDVGTWFAVMEEGTCTSIPSDIITVTEMQSTSLPTPEISVNGQPIASVSTFCQNGRIDLKLSNLSSYSGVTIRWYNGQTYLGEGESISIIAPIEDTFILRCVVSDNTGTLCSSEKIETKTLSGSAPNSPGIAGTPFICGGIPATLTATITGTETYTYEWYRNDVLLAETSQTLSVAETGTYRVAAIQGGCISTKSQPVTVGLSDFPMLTWIAGVDRSEPNEIKTYQVSGTFNPSEYTWSVDDTDAAILNGQGSNIVNIRFPNKGTAGSPHPVKITVVANNTCGESDPLEKTVGVSPFCTPINIRNTTMNPSSGKMLIGNTLTMSVTATGSNLSYQWKLDGSIITGATNATYTIDNAQTNHSGTYSCVVTSICEGTFTEEATVGTIEILNMTTIASGTGILVGENCFDIAQSNDGSTCGVLSLRKKQEANFAQTYTYTFYNKGDNNTNLQFLIDDPLEAVESYTVQPDIPTTLINGGKYIIAIKYKEQLKQTAIGLTNNNAIKVNIFATYNTLGSNTTYKNVLEVNIKDCDCCRIMADAQGNEYTTYQFGNAGCWMTQNIRSTSNAVLNSGQSTSVARYYYPGGITGNGLSINPEYGLLYNWTAANIICPSGWQVPTDAQWNALEQEIAENKERYSTTTAETPWNSSASTTIDSWRGAWGQSMKSPISIGSATNGKSNTNGSGFNAYMVGFMWEGNGNAAAYNSGTYFWTSTTGTSSGGKARKITRYYKTDQSGVYRTNNFTYDFIPVRCIKK